ncbi:MAG: glucose-6-phosphate isomerase [Peptoniphilus sp.]|nr:glucose-6-phosphate isomerase [Peptoniphilus sp.]MDY3118443.1 glucose-6-phosphate isomerase [Peptoniphilus sp.]
MDLRSSYPVDERSWEDRVCDGKKILEDVQGKKSPGCEWCGWMDYPSRRMAEDIEEVTSYVKTLQARDLYVLGIGGSFLGAYAALSALHGSRVHFYGNSFSASDLEKGLAAYDPAKDHVVVISKSGSTRETAIAFRLFLQKAVDKGVDLSHSFTAITDGKRGKLHDFADKHGICRFVVPDDMGGRYSVLSPVGLFPMAFGGIDLEPLMAGAVEAEKAVAARPTENAAFTYALLRDSFRREGKVAEIFATYEPHLAPLGRWWQQLFGESEGKEHRGLMPVTLTYSTDLHAMGQWVQEGPRNVFETVLYIEHTGSDLVIPAFDMDDGLHSVEGRTVEEVNRAAFMGTRAAHEAGGVPTISMVYDRFGAYELGEFLYIMEYACAISAYLDGVNPFDQPGVEAYKKAMAERLSL